MINKLLEIVRRELGYKEGSNNNTKYGAWYGLNNQPWCAMFISWCANQTGITEDIIPKFASCTIGYNWFKQRDKIIQTNDVQAGDILFFNWDNINDPDHVGIVEKVEGNIITTIEGNASNERSGEGDCVKRRTFPKDYKYIFAVARPNYKGNLQYRVHMQDLGWSEFINAGVVAGTTGEERRIEAVQFKLPQGLEMKVKAHIQDIGWTDWQNAEDIIGTTGQQLRLEALEINSNKELEFQEHIQDIGWLPVKRAKAYTLGTVGKSLRLEAFKINIV